MIGWAALNSGVINIESNGVRPSWKVTITATACAITRGNKRILVSNDMDIERVQKCIQGHFNKVVDGYYFFRHEETIQNVYAKYLLVQK